MPWHAWLGETTFPPPASSRTSTHKPDSRKPADVRSESREAGRAHQVRGRGSPCSEKKTPETRAPVHHAATVGSSSTSATQAARAKSPFPAPVAAQANATAAMASEHSGALNGDHARAAEAAANAAVVPLIAALPYSLPDTVRSRAVALLARSIRVHTHNSNDEQRSERGDTRAVRAGDSPETDSCSSAYQPTKPPSPPTPAAAAAALHVAVMQARRTPPTTPPVPLHAFFDHACVFAIDADNPAHQHDAPPDPAAKPDHSQDPAAAPACGGDTTSADQKTADTDRRLASVVAQQRAEFHAVAQAYRKLNDLRANPNPAIKRVMPDAVGVRDVWLLFLLAKSAITERMRPERLSAVHAYHLLHAVVVAITQPLPNAAANGHDPSDSETARSSADDIPSSATTVIHDFCAATGALHSEVCHYLHRLRERALPPAIVENRLPLKNLHSRGLLRALSGEVETHFEALLDDPDSPVFLDERAFIDAPHLVSVDDPDVETADNTSNTRAHALVRDAEVSTSADQTRAVTAPLGTLRAEEAHHVYASPRKDGSASRRAGEPHEFAKFTCPSPRKQETASYSGSLGGGDALDALAAVASSTPRSPAVSRYVAAFESDGRRGVTSGADAAAAAVAAAAAANAIAGISPAHRRPGADAAFATTPPRQERAVSFSDTSWKDERQRLDASRMPPPPPPPSHSSHLNGTAGSFPVHALNPMATPMTSSLAAVTWLHEMADSRPETVLVQCGGDAREVAAFLGGTPGGVQTTTAMTDVLKDEPNAWGTIVTRLRELCAALSAEETSFASPQHVREAAAVYFAGLESVLVYEARRLANDRRRVQGVVKSVAFHKSILVCAFETVSAAYGHRSVTMMPLALRRFELTPFELSKCVETFVRRLNTLPANVARHIAMCEHRLLESMVWQPDSPLVVALHARAIHKDAPMRPNAFHRHGTADASTASRKDTASADTTHERAAEKPETGTGGTRPESESEEVHNAEEGDTKPDSNRAGHGSTSPSAKGRGNEDAADKVPVLQAPPSVPETALELFFLKFLAISADRTQQLIALLGLEVIVEDVWSVVKHCSWDKWPLMVGRHLDQIIMCSIYGVAKVRQIPLTFMDIITQYRVQPHVCEQSFMDLIPNTFRDVSLASGQAVAAEAAAAAAVAKAAMAGAGGELGKRAHIKVKKPDAAVSRGDIIKFYNQVFIHATKSYLLGLRTSASGITTKPSDTAHGFGAGKDGTTSRDSGGSYPHSGFSHDGTSSQAMSIGRPSGAHTPKDEAVTPSTPAKGSTGGLDDEPEQVKRPRGLNDGGTASPPEKRLRRSPEGDESEPATASSRMPGSGDSATQPGTYDRVEAMVLQSPLKMQRKQLPSRRIGSVTVSPMSPQGRCSLALRQSPSRLRAGAARGTPVAMTPGTRALYAFGESPSKGLDRINRSVATNDRRLERPPLSFDHVDTSVAGMRRRQGNVLRRSGLIGSGADASAPAPSAVSGARTGVPPQAAVRAAHQPAIASPAKGAINNVRASDPTAVVVDAENNDPAALAGRSQRPPLPRA